MAREIIIPIKVIGDGINQTTSSFSELNDQVRKLLMAAKSGDIDGVTNSFGNLSKSISGAKNALSSVTSSLGVIGGAAVALGAALVGVGLAIDKLTQKFDEMNAKIKTIQRSFQVTRQAAMELNASFVALAKSGLDLEGKFGQVNAISKNLNISLGATVLLIQKFHDNLSPEQTEEAIEQLAEYGQYYQKLGYSAQEAANIIANAYKQGGFQDKVSDSIKEFSIRVNDLSDAQKEMAKNAGLEKVLENISSGSISGAEGISSIIKRLNELKSTGKDVTPIITALFGAPGEDAEKTLLMMDSLVSKSIEVNAIAQRKRDLDKEIEESNQRILENMNTSSKLWDWVASKGKELYLHLEGMLSPLASIGDSLSSIAAIGVGGLLSAFSEVFRIVSGISNVLSSWLELDFSNISEKFMAGYNEVDNRLKQEEAKRKKEEEENKRKANAVRVARENCAKSGGTWDELNGKCVPKAGSSGGGTSGVSPTEVSSITEAAKRLSISLQKELNAIELAEKKKEMTKEDAALAKIKIEEKYNEKVIALAQSLQGQTAIIDGKTVIFKKITTDELKKIESDRLKFTHDTAMAEIDITVEKNKRLLELETISNSERAAIQESNQKLLEQRNNIRLLKEEQTWVGHFYTQLEIEREAHKSSIDLLIKQHNDEMALTTLTKEEREIKEKQHLANLSKLRIEYRDKQLKDEIDIEQKRQDIINETLEIIKSNERKAISNIQGGGVFVEIANNAIDGLNKFKDIKAKSEDIAKRIFDTQKQLEEAVNANDMATANLLEKKLVALSNIQDDVNVEKFANGIKMAGDAIIGITSAITSFIIDSNNAMIATLDIELEKRKEILDVVRQQATAEEGRLKTVLEIDESRNEAREKELEDLSQNIPEAAKARLEQEKVEEEERINNTKARVAYQISEEKRRVKENELAVKTIENKKLALMEENFEAERAAKISQAIMSGLVAAVQAWVNPGFPLAIPLSAFILAQSGLTVGQLAGQKNPYTKRYAKGTLSVEGGIEGKDSVDAVLMPGEAVIPTKVNKRYSEAVKAIFTQSIPADVLNSFVSNYRGGNTPIVIVDNKDIVEAINNKPVSLVNIDEDGFSEYIIRTIDDKNRILRKLNKQ